MKKGICRVCGGQAKKSKGIVNYHDLQWRLKPHTSVEFETKIVNCLKCVNCGHSWNEDKS